jgi:hypothetical protein
MVCYLMHVGLSLASRTFARRLIAVQFLAPQHHRGGAQDLHEAILWHHGLRHTLKCSAAAHVDARGLMQQQSII